MASIVKEKKKTLTERLQIIDTIAEKTNKKYGKTIMGRIANNEEIMDTLKIEFITTPSIAFNNAVGGGIPKRRCTIISGLSDSGVF